MGGQAPSRCTAVAACGDESGGKICGRFAQAPVGQLQLEHFGGTFARRLVHDAPPYSGVRASGKPGAVQRFKCSFGLLEREPDIPMI